MREAWMPPPNAARRLRESASAGSSGQGSAVVLVHGIPTSAELSRHVPPLVGEARLFASEVVGYGLSWNVNLR
jgi:pimeloyl-ACP methyl ester carboxylesterase